MITKTNINSGGDTRLNEALISIHDVMPETLPETRRILDLLMNFEIKPITLLVIPGKNWTEKDIDILMEFQGEGYRLAGHGWDHHCLGIKTIFHRIHGVLISGMEAEHLSLSKPQVMKIMHRCYSWFRDHDIGVPDLYVPPAWALGSVAFKDLEELPFTLYETFTGIYSAPARSFYCFPLIGFEADTGFRIRTLRILNSLNRGLCHLLKRPLRIAIHPYDLHFGLAPELNKQLSKKYSYIHYSDLDFKTSHTELNDM